MTQQSTPDHAVTPDLIRSMIWRHARIAWLGALLTLTTLTVSGAFAQTTATQASNATSTNDLEEIVVTASKRNETLKEAPTAITALTAAKLDELGVSGFRDYLGYVPSLELNDYGAAGVNSIGIRGIAPASTKATPTIGYYLDDTPLTPSSSASIFGGFSPDPDLADVDHIEVLKGPQSTLYGASTLGGLIKIVTEKPDLNNFGGNASISGVTVAGGGSGGSVRGSVNLPLVQDKLAVRLSGYGRDDPGFIDNIFNGQKNINDVHAQGGRIALRFAPTSQLDIDLAGLVQHTTYGGGTYIWLQPDARTPLFGVNKISDFINGAGKSQLSVVNLAAHYDTGVGTVTSASGYVKDNVSGTQDVSRNFPAAFFLLPFLGVTNPSSVAISGAYLLHEEKYTEDLRFDSTRWGNFQWQLGAFYTHEQVANPNDYRFTRQPGGTALTPVPNVLSSSNGTYKEYAGYGDVTYYFTDSLDLTAGIRYSHYTEDSSSLQDGLISRLFVPGFIPNNIINQTFADSDKSYLGVLRWRPTQNLSTYARAASAYRPGGPSTISAPGSPKAFGPDTDWNYEVGAKSRWLDGRLTANIAVYDIEWRNIQLNATDPITGLIVIGNGGNAVSRGVEFDGTFAPARGLTFGATASYDNAHMKSVTANNAAGANVGDPLPFTPKWTGSLTADYSAPLSADVTGGLGASALYRGEEYSAFSADTVNTRVLLPGYTTFAVRGHLDWRNYALAFNVDNITNKLAYSTLIRLRFVDPFAATIPFNGTPIRPRTYRLTLSTRF